MNGNYKDVAPAKAGAQRRSLHYRTSIKAIALRRYQPGLGPRPNSFLCFAKERNQRKATADLPFGCLRCAPAQIATSQAVEDQEKNQSQKQQQQQNKINLTNIHITHLSSI
ncbi:hypothetical protein ACO0LD_12735 [Undibacterium sp. Ji83W]|uniref:hypothetical protein n=1 Tax=Undibacterium sp. Ji83W TaxID=3413043 RepID=UPI003BEFE722